MALLSVLMLLALSPAHASLSPNVLPMVSGFSATTNESAGPGSLYSYGLSLDAYFGEEDDLSNRTGDMHGNFTQQLEPLDPTDDTSPLKHVNNWAAGASVAPFAKSTLGIDLDSSSDRFEMLFSDGVKATIGYEPIRLSYRYARSTIQQGFSVLKSSKPKPTYTDFSGAFIYQQTLSLELDLDLGTSDLLTFIGSGSLFTPNVAQFADTVALIPSGSISDFEDTLQNFEQWACSTDWEHDWSSKWISEVSLRYSHLIIPANPLFDLNLSVGYSFTDSFRLKAGWDYSHDPLNHQALYQLQARYSWDRD